MDHRTRGLQIPIRSIKFYACCLCLYCADKRSVPVNSLINSSLGNETMSKTCAICAKPTGFTCAGCKLVSYCGKDHQREDWKARHKAACKPLFQLQTNNVYGRHLVASRLIRKGELIFQESPLVIGPKSISGPICLGCHGPCGATTRECDGCGYPLCSVQCQVADAHFDECQVMMKKKFRAKVDTDSLNLNQYGPIVPLRILIMKEKQPEKFKKIMGMESHIEERMKTQLYAAYKQNLAGFLINRLGITNVDENIILTVAAILDTNAFEVRLRERKLRALYGTAAMMAHDCTPNTRHTFHGNECNIAVSATVDIPAGSPITATYTQSFWGTLARQAHLRVVKCFKCTCSRCSDPTELDTYIGAFRCIRCATQDNFTDGPKMVSKSPLDDNAPWHCRTCHHEVPAKQVKMGNENLKDEINRLEKSIPVELEEFLTKYGVESKGVLHPTNSFVIQVKHALVQMYGNHPALSYAELSPQRLEKKVEYCQELLDIIDKVNPGFSRIRGQILAELQAAMVMQAKILFKEGKITKEAAQEALEESMAMLGEVIEIMKNEPDAEDVRKRLERLGSELDE